MNIELIIDQLKRCNINNPLEQAHFLAQCECESSNFKNLSENSNYRFKTAKRVFNKYRMQIEAKQRELEALEDNYCPQPWLFNLVYGERLGNQDNGIFDDDGFVFRGGGLLQLTGKDNYQQFMDFANNHGYKLNLETVTNFVQSEEGAVLSAIWFWQVNNIGKYAVYDNVLAVSKLINCGNLNVADNKVLGLSLRKAATLRYKSLLGVS